MPYLTPSGLVDALTPLDGAAVGAANLDDARLADAITLAEAEIDGRLSDLYITPFDPPPDLIVMLDAWIAGYNAVLEAAGSVPIDDRDPARIKYVRAMDMLARLAAGILVLPPGTPVPDPGVSGSDGVTDGVDRYPDLCVQGSVRIPPTRPYGNEWWWGTW